MDFSKLFGFGGGKREKLPESKLSVNELVEMSQRSHFKVSIKERSSNLGKIKYIGFKYSFHRDNSKKLVLYMSLYFYMQGASFNMTKNKKNKTVRGKKKPRETYLLVAKFPYNRRIKNMKRLWDVPLQLFSSDPSFKYYFAYALNEMGAVVTDDNNLVGWLGKSLKDAPKRNNPAMKTELTKHFYKFFQFISNVRPMTYLDRKYKLPNDVRIKNERI